MDQPVLRLAEKYSWLELAPADEENEWRVRAEYCETFTADFTTCLTVAEAADFAERMLARLDGSPHRFSERVSEGRNNPFELTALPLGSVGFVLMAFLTPNGDDTVCHLQLEFGPFRTEELRAGLGDFRAALAV
ncbi:hypothetical protein [Kitasatospora sp. NPDC101183]|uniref:hypothetical protein n=1 Tax=Kitasatospora sp. NPDC101183 TaxID=3364100 RepID=UPI00380BB00B